MCYNESFLELFNYRIKPPGKNNIAGYQNPLGVKLYTKTKEDLRANSEILKAERQVFMSRLHRTRYLRATVETIAAIIIQKIARGYNVRCHVEEIVAIWIARKKFYNTLKGLCDVEGLVYVDLSTKRENYTNMRYNNASTIQRAFRCYISRILLRRKYAEAIVRRRHHACIKIQCMVRCVLSKDKVKRKYERYMMLRRMKASLLIQNCFRRYYSHQRVNKRRYVMRWIAARLIQSAFRGKQIRKAMIQYFHSKEKQRKYLGARSVQRIIRGRLSRTRFLRIKLRKLYLRLHNNVCKIQCCIRRFVSSRIVKRLLSAKKLKCQLEEERVKAQELQRVQAEELAEAQLLLDSTDILLQAKNGNTSGVDALYHHDQSASISAVNGDGENVLEIAARYGHLEIVRKCVLWGFDLSHVNNAGESVLSIAANSGHLNIALYLLIPSKSSTDASTFLTSTGQNEWSTDDIVTVLQVASRHSDLSYMMKLLQHDVTHINTKHSVNEMTILHTACESGTLDMVRMLLKYKADINVVDEMGQTPFHKASGSSNMEVLQFLLGLNIGNGESNNSYSDELCGSDEERMSKLLAKDNDGKDCLLLASLNGRTSTFELITQILGKEVEKTLGGKIGWTPNDIARAMKLVENGQLSCLKHIIDAGYENQWATEEVGDTLAITACKFGQIEIIDYLMDINADFSITNKYDSTPFHTASECVTQAVIPHILSSGKYSACKITMEMIYQRDVNGNTPLHIAAKYGSSLSYDLFAQDAMEIATGYVNNDHMTPLMVACAYNQSSKIMELLEYKNGASASDHVDSNGKNCLWYYFFPLVGVDSKDNKSTVAINSTLQVDIVVALLKYGCKLFLTPFSNNLLEKSSYLRQDVKFSTNEGNSNIMPSFEPVELCAFEMKFQLLNALIPLITPEECWRVGKKL
jgi:ankyrin repeat protein